MKDRMYVLKHCETGEYIASRFRGFGKYKVITLNKLKENNIYFKENDMIKNLFSKNYHIHFRGGENEIKMQPSVYLKLPDKAINLTKINPKELFNTKNNNQKSILINRY